MRRPRNRVADETCVCGHTADEHDVDISDVLGECRSPECQCTEFLLDPDTQTAPEVEWLR